MAKPVAPPVERNPGNDEGGNCRDLHRRRVRLVYSEPTGRERIARRPRSEVHAATRATYRQHDGPACVRKVIEGERWIDLPR